MPIFKISPDGKQVEEFHEHESSEEHLRTVFEHHGLRFIEKGLRFVDRNVSAGRGFIDTLAVDGDNRPTVIEYKVNEDASASALVQSLSYAYYLQKNREYFARLITRKLDTIKDDDLDFEHLRIILVAPGFDSHIVEAAQMVDPQAKLLKYSIYKTPEGEALSTTVVSDSTSTRGSISRETYSMDDHFYGRYSSMKPAFEKLALEVKKRLGVDPYYRSAFIGFKRNFMFIDAHVYTDRIELGLPLPDGATPSSRFQKALEGRFTSRVTHVARIQGPQDVDEELMAIISQAYNSS